MNLVKLLRNGSVLIACLCCLAASLPARAKPAAGAQAQGFVGQAEALLALSEQQNYHNHALALQTAQQALGLWQALANSEGIARAYAMLGRCYFAQSDLLEATKNYQNALHIWRDQNNPQEEAEMLIMLGYIEDRKGEWRNAISFLTQAQSLIEEKNEPAKMGQIASGLADVFNESGSPEDGLIQYQRALDYYRQTPDTLDDTMTVWALGSTYHLLGNYPEALSNLQQALGGVVPGSPYAALCDEYLGRVYSSMGDFPNALRHLETALESYTRANNPIEAARARGLIGQVYQQQGKLEGALRNYRESLTIFAYLSDRINQAAIYYAMGRLEFQRLNYKAAEVYLRHSIDVTEDIRRVPTSRDLTVAFSATIYDRYEKYIQCLMRQYEAHPAQGLVVRAFEASELSRARSLAELLRATQTDLVARLDPKLAKQEKTLWQALKVKEDYRVALLSRAYRKEELVAVDAELAQLQTEYKQLNETIRERYPAYEQITRPGAWDLRQIQGQVLADDETVLLEYSLSSDKSCVWAVTRDHIKSFNLPARALIEGAAQKVYKLLATPPAPDADIELMSAIQELGRMILSPVAAELSKRRILIVADGALHYIPFQVLPAPSADGEPLVAGYEIINIPSASILGELREEATRRQPAKVLAAFGDPVFASNYEQRRDSAGPESSAAMRAIEIAPLQNALRDVELNRDSFDPSVIKPLFYAKRELANLRDASSSGENFIASGFAATREQLLRMDLTQYSILHFATHGLLDPRRPENSGLILSTVNRDGQAQNGFVGLQDIYGLRATVDLVVLSACQTALGKDVRGEGLLGLTRGFMYAGASSVMASLWKVDDEATAELMHQSYINMLRKGMTPAAALRAAQNSIRQRPEWKSPYFWAGFTLQGEYLQVIKPVPNKSPADLYRKVIMGGALILLASIALWYGLHRRRTRLESE